MPARLFRLALVACVLLLAPASLHAEFPYVADPNRCDASGQPLGCIPLANEMNGAAGSCSGEKWKYASTSFCSTDPLVNLSPNELFGVTGMSVEIAWRHETGRSDVVIAVHDSGFMWNDDGAVNDLRKKFRLNRGELPAPAPAGGCSAPPGGDPWDCNGDGVFNVPDYDGDPAVANVNGNAATDPQDLIMLFSDGVDDDGNGYVDDVCGWDFFENDNDPFDEVQYGHGTGEARDSAAEANNGGAIATCPNCMTLPVRVGDSFVADVNSFAQGVVFAVDSGAAVIQEALGTYNQDAADCLGCVADFATGCVDALAGPEPEELSRRVQHHARPDADRDRDPHADADAHGDADHRGHHDADADRHADRDVHRHSGSYGDADGHLDRDPDADRDPELRRRHHRAARNVRAGNPMRGPRARDVHRVHALPVSRRRGRLLRLHGLAAAPPRRSSGAAPPVPEFLLPLRAKVAAWTGIAADAFVHALVTEYRPGTQLGWHRDVPEFGVVVGVSLAGRCRMRFRPWPPDRATARAQGFALELAPRSAYVLRRAVRWRWQHAISPTKELRYAITLRTSAGRVAG